MDNTIISIKEKCNLISQNSLLNINELVELVNADEVQANTIFEEANKVRALEMGNEVHLRGLIEFSNYFELLNPGDKILIAEACTHYPSHEDIGRVKIPNWLKKKVGGKLDFK